MNANKFWKTLFRTMLVILGVVFFPIGLFMLGYLIGSNKGKKKLIISTENPSKLIEKEIVKEPNEENADRVVI